MMTNKFNNAETYRTAPFNTAREFVPRYSAFASQPNEIFFMEPYARVPYEKVLQNYQNGEMSEFDIKVLSLIATFACAGMTTKALQILLSMMGEDVYSDQTRLSTALYHLAKNGLISWGRFKSLDRPAAALFRMIRLTYNGYKFGKLLGIVTRFNPVEVLDAANAKTRLQLTTLVTQFLKHLPYDVEEFDIRPMYSKRMEDPDAVVRPYARIRVFGEDMFVEIVRSGTEDYLVWLTDKLRRYTRVFEQLPNLLINGESEEHNRLIHAYLTEHCAEHGFPLDNMHYTHDLALFGNAFRSCLYVFGENGDKICFTFPETEGAGNELTDTGSADVTSLVS
jgi:hypothetical protein